MIHNQWFVHKTPLDKKTGIHTLAIKYTSHLHLENYEYMYLCRYTSGTCGIDRSVFHSIPSLIVVKTRS